MSPVCIQHLDTVPTLPAGTYRPTTYTNLGTITNAPNAYDTLTTSYANISASAVAVSSELKGFTVMGFQQGAYTGTLTVRRAYSLLSNRNGEASDCAVKIAYSVDDGATWTSMLSASSYGGESNATVAAGDITAPISVLDLSKVRVQFTATANAGVDELEQITATASCYIYAYDVRVS